MTQRTWMLGLLAALLVVTVAEGGQKGPLPASGGVSFNSKVAFDVYARKALDEEPELIARTPSEKPLHIPRCLSWRVRPRRPVDMKKVREEIEAKGIPGLRLSHAKDGDLAHLKGLTALERLYLHYTKITDAGLAHLKGLTALKTLDLTSCRQVTDAGLAHLKGLTALEGLDLTWCTQVTDAGVAELKKALPGLTIRR